MTQLVEIRGLAARSLLGLAVAASVNNAAVADDSVSIDDIRFASQIGTPVLSRTTSLSPPQPLQATDYRGSGGSFCSALDLDTFLRQFDPHELLNELRQSLLSGAQSEISNYLIALAYSAPTLASVLDMTDRQLHARFTAFSQTCASQQVRAVASQDAERRLAQASDQCFELETSRGAAPTDAYRICTVSRRLDGLALPATLTTLDFLRQHSDLTVTPRIKSLLAMLPDEQIVGGSYQVRPPQTTLGRLSDAIAARSRLALNRVIEGAPPDGIAECAADSILNPTGPVCLPRTALEVVQSPALRGARLLGPAALSMFKDALSNQIAITAVYADLLELGQQIAGMNLRFSSDASASEIRSRQRTLQDQVVRLLGEADLRFKLQQSKLQLARTQLVALERSRADLQAQSDALQTQRSLPGTGLITLLRLFQNPN
jgi:AraC-like DNA-binding protein